MPNYPLYPDAPPKDVRCLTCGGLGATHVDEGGTVVVSDFPYAQRFDKRTNHVPHCIRGYWDITAHTFEIAEKRAKASGKSTPDDPKGLEVGEASLEVLNEHRECDGWFPCLPGVSVEAQFQMHDMIELEEDRRQWEQIMEKERRAFEERLDNSNKEFLTGLEEQRKAWASDSAKWPNRLIVAACIFAAGQVVAALIALPAIARWFGFD